MKNHNTSRQNHNKFVHPSKRAVALGALILTLAAGIAGSTSNRNTSRHGEASNGASVSLNDIRTRYQGAAITITNDPLSKAAEVVEVNATQGNNGLADTAYFTLDGKHFYELRPKDPSKALLADVQFAPDHAAGQEVIETTWASPKSDEAEVDIMVFEQDGSVVTNSASGQMDVVGGYGTWTEMKDDNLYYTYHAVKGGGGDLETLGMEVPQVQP